MGTAALLVPEYVAATTAASAALPAAAAATSALAPAAIGASEVGASALPGTIESAGLLDMGAGNLINPEYFVGESLGMPMFAGSPDAPLLERAGSLLGSFGDQMSGNGMKMLNTMRSFGQPQGQPRPVAQQAPRTRANMNQPQQQSIPMYNQAPVGVQLTEEQKEMLRRRMYG